MILNTAISILRDYGLADLTMRRLARQLDVAPGALYWHFPNKQELLGGIADHLVSTIQPSDDGTVSYCVALFTAMTSLPSGAEITLAASASGTLDQDPSRELPLPVWHYVVGAAIDFQTREEAAHRLGISSPPVVDIAAGVSALMDLGEDR